MNKRPLTIKFQTEKETLNTIRFEEIVQGMDTPHIGKLYLRKTTWEALGKPDNLLITVTGTE